MRKIDALVCVPLLAAAAPAAVPDGRVSVLVHLAPQTERSALRLFAADRGASVHHEYAILPSVVNLRGLPETALASLRGLPGVVRVEEDLPVRAFLNDSTPLLGALQSQIGGAGLEASGAGARVCVIDTGIDLDHLMFADRIDAEAGIDLFNGDADPSDDNGHGTHVAGIAVGGAGLSVDTASGPEPFQGVAPGATLIGVKALGSNGQGLASDVIMGIEHCASAGLPNGRADVINLSLGGGAFTQACDGESLAVAVNNAVAAGVTVVAASGNEGFVNAVALPACASGAIAVGSTYDDTFPNLDFPTTEVFQHCIDTAVPCTTFCVDALPAVDQLVCSSNGGPLLAVTAPGCAILSGSPVAPNAAAIRCGTSQAAPQASGLAALLLGFDPALTPAAVRQIMQATAVDLGPPGFDADYGHGRVNALAALALASGAECFADPQCDDADPCTADACELAAGGGCVSTPVPDSDADGHCDAADNCPAAPNADQADGDGDGVGLVCDGCPTVADPRQQDGDGDLIGDACEDPVINANVDVTDASALRIDGSDLFPLARAFGTCEGAEGFAYIVDLDRDRCVDGMDLALLASVWARDVP
jgi:subtilisin family serine protease